MLDFDYFLWLLTQVGALAILPAIIAGVVVAAIWKQLSTDTVAKPSVKLWLQLALPTFVALEILFFAALAPVRTADVYTQNLFAVNMMFCSEIPLVIYLVWSFRGMRRIAAILCLAQLWFALLAWFVATMSVSHSWF
ncbi:MAG: hypothetical protein H7Y38_18855 [Armatimonadetes bacterium]|nr:hypothetical protein [Armatimonadota bacterium]